jgi:hypothetical protein
MVPGEDAEGGGAAGALEAAAMRKTTNIGVSRKRSGKPPYRKQ